MDKTRKSKNLATPSEQREKNSLQVKDFTFRDFRKIAETISLSQQEWSDLLHISERTLQRYAKTNGAFSFAVTDRILQIEKVIKKGISVFGSPEAFLSWLRSSPNSLEGKIELRSLSSIDGIQKV